MIYMVGAQLKTIRKNILNMTQKQLAEQLNMSTNAIAMMERGTMNIELRTELAIKWIVYTIKNVALH